MFRSTVTTLNAVHVARLERYSHRVLTETFYETASRVLWLH
jgi:hypothetical protein